MKAVDFVVPLLVLPAVVGFATPRKSLVARLEIDSP
jgi:hypothetical protein